MKRCPKEGYNFLWDINRNYTWETIWLLTFKHRKNQKKMRVERCFLSRDVRKWRRKRLSRPKIPTLDHWFQHVKASQDIGCFYLLFITFYLMGRAGIILKKDWNHEPFRNYCLTPNIQMHYVDIITAQKKQENPREDRKAVTFISYFLVIRLLFLDEDIFQGLD